MTTPTAQTSSLSIARLAGFLSLLTIPLGVFTFLYVPSSLIVSGDAATTADNLMASESLFRPGLVSDLLSPLVLILVVLVLYKLLKPVNKILFFFLGNYWPKRTYYKLSPKKII